MTDLPPVTNIAVTKMLVMRPKVKKTRCAAFPYLARTASRKVCALGARLFSLMEMLVEYLGSCGKLYRYTYSMASVAKRMICTVAPEAYQKGPEMP